MQHSSETNHISRKLMFQEIWETFSTTTIKSLRLFIGSFITIFDTLINHLSLSQENYKIWNNSLVCVFLF